MKMQLSNKTLSLWGKKNVNDDNEKMWLPLIAHLIDTKNVINWLYNHWINDGQRHILQRNFEDEDIVQNLVKFLGYIHDIGKATPAFQIKQSYIHNEDLDQNLVEKLLRNSFDGLDNSKIKKINTSKTPHALAGEVILENNGLNESIGAIIGGHHGKPQEEYFDYEDQLNNWTSNYYQSDSGSETSVGANWKQVQNELINYGLGLCHFNNLEDIPDVTEPQAVILEGLVIMADWLASGEYLVKDNQRVPLFPLIPVDQDFASINTDERYRQGISVWADLFDPWEPEVINNPRRVYKERWKFTPRQIQEKMSETIGASLDPGIIIVEAPMGIGKTEIALTAVEQLAAKTGMNGLFFGLPTQATANAMFNRVDKWLSEIATDQKEKLQIKLMHGKAQFNEEYRNIPNADNIEDGSSSVVVNEWFNGKKSILSSFVIGTVDQLLLMGLKQKHLALRHLGMSGKVVVIDEVHAYDIYMDSYLEKAVQWLGAYHVPVIALSATLPVAKRNSLLQTYCVGKYGNKRFKTTNEDWKTCHSYPLLSILDGKTLKQVSDFSDELKNTSIEITRLNIEDSELIKTINQKISDGGVAGVIVNTVRRAQELARLAESKMPSDVNILVLHSAFLATDRRKLENKLQDAIGKNKKRPYKMIVIGTQVLEQSLDIDFDVMYTDIAPMDLILQRIGRLHRHQIQRPKKLEKPQLYIMGINEFGNYGDANESIYAKYLLTKTDYFLKDKVNIPSDISDLVQKVYSETTDSEIKNLRESKQIFEINQKKSKHKANGYQIEAPDDEETLHGWLDNDSGTDLKDSKAEAAVRDTNESIEIVLLYQDDKGYNLLNGQSIEDVYDNIIAQQLIRLPHALTINIDRSIEELEKITTKHFPQWKDSNWLKGSLALVLDKNKETEFNGYSVKYSRDLGLIYKKE